MSSCQLNPYHLETDINSMYEIMSASKTLDINFGEIIGIKSTSAQITNYSLDELIGKQVIGICNLPAKNIAGFVSEVLILGAISGKDISLLQADKNLKNGTLIG